MRKPPARTVLRRALAKTIRELRQRAGLAQERLALEAGVDRGYMGGLERGLHSPTLETVYKLLPALGVDFIEFARVLERILDR
jgi:transcriptional regulator with XRE-family HTH domain